MNILTKFDWKQSALPLLIIMTVAVVIGIVVYAKIEERQAARLAIKTPSAEAEPTVPTPAI